MLIGCTSNKGENRVVRGGSWNNNGRNCRSAIRNRNEPDNRNNNLGFRLISAQVQQSDDLYMTRWHPVPSVANNCYILDENKASQYVSKTSMFESLLAQRFYVTCSCGGHSSPYGTVLINGNKRKHNFIKGQYSLGYRVGCANGGHSPPYGVQIVAWAVPIKVNKRKYNLFEEQV